MRTSILLITNAAARCLTLASLAALAGCSSSSTPAVANDASTPATDSSTPVADSSRSDDAGAADAADAGAMGAAAFVGTWARSGTLELTCPGNHVTTQAITGNLVITAGTTANGIIATQPNGCVANLTVAGNLATEGAGETCSATSEAGVSDVLTEQTHTLTVSPDGTTLTEASAGSVALTFVDGGTEDCTETTSGSFAKQ